jgi:hypothetical protein
MAGFHEIAESLDGAVHDLRHQHQGGDHDDEEGIHPVAGDQRNAAASTTIEKASFQATLKS